MDRRIRGIKKDRNGNIVALCNAGESWSPRLKKDVMRDINESKQSYYVEELERRSYVRVVSGRLQTTADENSRNHLERLPAV